MCRGQLQGGGCASNKDGEDVQATTTRNNWVDNDNWVGKDLVNEEDWVGDDPVDNEDQVGNNQVGIGVMDKARAVGSRHC